MNENTLLDKIRQGDTQAFKSLFNLYYLPLCRFSGLYLVNKQEVEEVVMDIFVYLWEHRQSLQIETSLKAYLFQAARNRTYNVLRNKLVTLPFDQLTHEPSTQMELTLEMEELHDLIREAILTLPERCRTVFYLSRDENKSNRQIADSLDISVKTVEAQITKALKQIKKYLDLNNRS